MFHKFKNQEERKNFGGTAFVEFAYCKNKSKLKILNRLLKRKNIFWNDDSLYIYVDDVDEFYNLYDDTFKVNNFYGSNYYSKEKTIEIINSLKQKQPKDYLVLVEWLESALMYDGFWIYGI